MKEKTLLIILTLISIWFTKNSMAQKGPSCDSAKVLTYPINTSVTSYTDNAYWFKVTLDTGNYIIHVSNTAGAGKIYKADVYNGSCATLTLVSIDSLFISTNTEFNIRINNTVNTKAFYIKLYNKGGSVSFSKTMATSVHITGEIGFCPGQSIKLYALPVNPIGTQTFTWQPGGSNSNPVAVTPSNTNTPTTYTLYYNDNGGTLTTTVNIFPLGPDQCKNCEQVQNGHFEWYDGYSTSVSNISHSYSWSTASLGTSDYYNVNYPYPVSVPANYPATSTPAHNGNGYAGFITYTGIDPNAREYIQSQLKCPLVVGQNYNVSFYTIAGDKFGTVTNNIGAYLSGLPTYTPNVYYISGVTPQVNSSSVINYSTSWTQVSGIVTGNNQQFITIGNFYSDPPNTTILNPASTSTLYPNYSYYFVDDISVTPVPPTLTTSSSSITCNCASTITLTATGSNSLYTSWSNGITTYSGSVVSIPCPTATTIYTCNVNLPCGNCTPLTNTIMVVVSPTLTVTPNYSIIYAGQSVTLTATGNTAPYTWNPGALTGSVVVVTPTANTVYTVTGICSAQTTATVIVSNACSISNNGSIGTSTTSTVNFPASTTAYTVTGFVYDMQGVITFTGNTTFTGYTFRMAKGTKLKVNGGVTLTFNNCKLYGCTELWYGIELNTADNNNANIDVRSGTTIEDMYYGIYREIPYAAGTSTQGYINITNSRLNKNYFGVQLINVKGPTPVGSTYSLTVKTSTLTTASSTTSPGNNLKPSTIPTYTYAYNQIAGGASGSTTSYTAFPRAYTAINLVSLSPASNVVIGDSAGAANTFNTFSNLDFGIVSSNAQLRVHNNSFINLKGSVKHHDAGDIFNPNPVPIGPDEIGIAIVAQHTVANTYSLQVGTRNGPATMSTGIIYPKSNTFKTLNKGISAKNCNVVIVKCNWFEADTTNIPGSDYTIPGSTNTYEYYKAQSAVWITGLSKGSTLSFNYIRNYRVGLNVSQTMSVTTGAYVTIRNNNIQSLSTVGYCRQAINLEQVGGANIATDLLDVSSNTINRVFNGIYAKTIAGGLKISNNTSLTLDNVKTYGKPLVTNYSHTGISLFNVTNGKVLTNTNINGLTTITASNYSLTNAVYVTTSASNTITCNTANNVGRGFYFQGNCTSPNGWLGNGINNTYRGLELKSSGVIGIQGAASSTLAANTWSNVTQETFVSGTMNANTASNMFVSPNSGALKTSPTLNFSVAPSPNYQTGPAQGIDEQTTGTPFSCGGGGTNMAMAESSLSSGSSTSTSNDGLFSNLATSSNTVYPTYADEMVYQSQQLVYALQKQGLVTKNASNPTLQSFYNSNINSNIGKFTDVQDAVASNNKNLAQSKNNSINPSNAVQQKTKRANELMLKLNINCNYQYTNTELQDLVSMANECEVKGWYVAQSRSILNTISGTLINYADNCEDTKANTRMANEEEKPTSSIEPKRSFNLFPNPNNGSMTMTYDLGKDTEGSMNLYDVTGKLINTYNLSTTIGSIEINEDKLHNGIYFYCILVNGIKVNTNKIVIIK
jgi:hypothetical protein